MLKELEIFKATLNEMVTLDDAVLCSGEILKFSQKLDKLIFVEQAIRMKREQSNYKEQLHSILYPELYSKLVA